MGWTKAHLKPPFIQGGVIEKLISRSDCDTTFACSLRKRLSKFK